MERQYCVRIGLQTVQLGTSRGQSIVHDPCKVIYTCRRSLPRPRCGPGLPLVFPEFRSRSRNFPARLLVPGLSSIHVVPLLLFIPLSITDTFTYTSYSAPCAVVRFKMPRPKEPLPSPDLLSPSSLPTDLPKVEVSMVEAADVTGVTFTPE